MQDMQEEGGGRGLVPAYDGCLLRLAVDLADRFMPAFDTPTGIPLSWVNLRHVSERASPPAGTLAACQSMSVCACLPARCAETHPPSRRPSHLRTLLSPSPLL